MASGSTFFDGYITSVYGRRLGLQQLSSGQSGSTTYVTGRAQPPEFLVGMDGIRLPVQSTGAVVATRLPAWGIHSLTTTASAATTETIYILDPPIAGVGVKLMFNSSNTGTNSLHVHMNAGTAGAIAFTSSAGSTMTVLGSTAGRRIMVSLMALNSTQWALDPFLSTAQISQTTVIA